MRYMDPASAQGREQTIAESGCSHISGLLGDLENGPWP
jgi:hypothetical protein